MGDDDIDFDIEEYEKALKADPKYPVNECVSNIEEIIDGNIIRLHMSVDNFLFQDIQYEKVISCMPQWVAYAGVGTEGACTKDYYESMRRRATHPIFSRFIYHYDLWSLIAALQDRLSAVCLFLRDFYKQVPCRTEYENNQYTNANIRSGEIDTYTHIQLNSIFVAIASSFDLLSKIATEQYLFDKYDFVKYKSMKSDEVLFNRSYQKNVAETLRADGMLFSSPLVVKKIVTFRDEYVHNGPWDLRCNIYEPWVNDEPVEAFIYAPDMDENGRFVTSGSRNKFYSQNNRINFQLPDMIKEVSVVLAKTIDELSRLYQEATSDEVTVEYTEECMKAIADYYKGISIPD